MKNKSVLYAIAALFVLNSCNDPKKQEKDLYTEVIKTHDEVMSKTDVAMHNKMMLDTLIMRNPAGKGTIEPYSKQLTIADEAMEDWMHHFDPDYSGKPHDEVMKYLTGEKAKIVKVDSMLTIAIRESNKFISGNKK
jgi:hypothetical protein